MPQKSPLASRNAVAEIGYSFARWYDVSDQHSFWPQLYPVGANFFGWPRSDQRRAEEKTAKPSAISKTGGFASSPPNGALQALSSETYRQDIERAVKQTEKERDFTRVALRKDASVRPGQHSRTHRPLVSHLWAFCLAAASSSGSFAKFAAEFVVPTPPQDDGWTVQS